MSEKTFSVILDRNFLGFRRGDELTCISIKKSTPGMIAILERPDCGRWPILFNAAGPETEAGAKLVGQVVSLHRNFFPGGLIMVTASRWLKILIVKLACWELLPAALTVLLLGGLKHD